MQIAAKIGLRLKQAREDAGLTLQELANRTGGSLIASRIGNYEQGTRLLKPDVALVIAPLLGVTAAWLLCVDEEASLAEDERALLRSYRSTDARGKETIRSIAKSQPDIQNSPDKAA